jgi:hypothetical protein
VTLVLVILPQSETVRHQIETTFHSITLQTREPTMNEA